MRLRLAVLAVLVFVLGISPMSAAGLGAGQSEAQATAAASADPVQADAMALAQAMDVPASDLISADLMGSDPRGAAVVDGRLGKSFPARGSSFAVLSTGVATDAALPDSTARSTVLDGSNNDQGNDLTRLHLQLEVPAGADCANFDVGFYSEEFAQMPPDFSRLAGSAHPEEFAGEFNDTFTAQLNNSTLATDPDGETVDAPGNFGQLAVHSVTHDPSTGTTYAESSPVMRASTPVVGGQVVDVYLSVQDLGDSQYDSAAFLDDFFWSSGVSCPSGAQADSDGDGLLDSWEEHGLTVNGEFVDLPAMGADPDHKDIFVEIDHMDATNSLVPLAPVPDAMADVEKAFADAPVENPDGTTGINLHIDYGQDAPISYGSSKTFGAMSQADTLPTESPLGTFGADDYDWSDFNAIKAQHFDQAREGVFHYALFGLVLPGDIEGIATLPGDDLAFGWGSVPNDGVSPTVTQAGTFMHELGHNLGLDHGGDSPVNYKPNYLSVMNYFFTNGDEGAGFKLDYSRSVLPPLDENSLDESKGIGTTDSTAYYCADGTIMTAADGSKPIDWQCLGEHHRGELPTGVVGSPYSTTTLNVESDVPVEFTAQGSLPPGLSLDAATGLISGTPTTAGTFAFTVNLGVSGQVLGGGTHRRGRPANWRHQRRCQRRRSEDRPHRLRRLAEPGLRRRRDRRRGREDPAADDNREHRATRRPDRESHAGHRHDAAEVDCAGEPDPERDQARRRRRRLQPDRDRQSRRLICRGRRLRARLRFHHRDWDDHGQL
jgi:hypothetical protein